LSRFFLAMQFPREFPKAPHYSEGLQALRP
jgi:hypothetical protein